MKTLNKAQMETVAAGIASNDVNQQIVSYERHVLSDLDYDPQDLNKDLYKLCHVLESISSGDRDALRKEILGSDSVSKKEQWLQSYNNRASHQYGPINY